jgi:DNA-directed RNA polymerase subunit RPC12/RpoP
MKCPQKKCRSKDMYLIDGPRMVRQLIDLIANPVGLARILNVFRVDTYAARYRCYDCGHRFARCKKCHFKWGIASQTRAGQTTRCSDCGSRVIFLGRLADKL